MTFAECCVFSKQSPGPFHCDLSSLRPRGSTRQEAHLLPKLRCHFAEFLHGGSLKRLGIFSLPTCVRLRYGHPVLSLEVFLGSVESVATGHTAPRSRLGVIGTTDLPIIPAYSLQAALPIAARPILLRHPIVITRTKWCRNVNLLPIDYAVRPRLRDRLTLSGLTLLRKPWAYGEQSSHLLYRYLCRQSHFYAVHQSLRSDFTSHRTLPYHLLARRHIDPQLR